MNPVRKQYSRIRVTKKLKDLQVHFGKMKTTALLLNAYNGGNYTPEQIDTVLEKGMDHAEDSVALLSELKKNIVRALKLVK